MLLSFLVVGNAYQIVHGDKPPCRTCKYFEPAQGFLSPKDKIRYGNCLYYGRKDLINGEVTHPFASVARVYEDCGVNGTRYVEDPDHAMRPYLGPLYEVFFRNRS